MKLFSRPLPTALLAVALVSAGGVLYAQLEGADRGVPPIDSASTLEVTGVQVDVSAKSGEEARYEGWRQAQGLGWKALWAKTTGRPRSEAPNLPDSVLNSIVSGIIIEEEERLGALDDEVVDAHRDEIDADAVVPS